MDCSVSCVLCFNTKKFFVNFSMYHGVCDDHYLVLNSCVCIHCQSIVVFIEFAQIFDEENPEDQFEPIESRAFDLPLFALENSENHLEIKQCQPCPTIYTFKLDSQPKIMQKLGQENEIKNIEISRPLDTISSKFIIEDSNKKKDFHAPQYLATQLDADDQLKNTEKPGDTLLIDKTFNRPIRPSWQKTACFIFSVLGLIITIIVVINTI